MLHLTRWSESFQRNKTSFDEWVKQISNYLFRTCQFTRFRIPFISNICNVLSIPCTTPFAEFDLHLSSVFALPWNPICSVEFGGHEFTCLQASRSDMKFLKSNSVRTLIKMKNDHFSNVFIGVFLCNFCFDSFQGKFLL